MNRRENCLNKGQVTENLFVQTMSQIGLTCNKASSYNDMVKKVDFYVGNSKQTKSFQIKAIPSTNSNYRCIEFKDVRGKNGWMVSEAEVVAFETETEFILVSINKIWDLMNNNLIINHPRLNSLQETIDSYYSLLRNSDSLPENRYMNAPVYTLYTREPWDGAKRYDFCTRVPLSDLESIGKKIPKN